MKKYKVGDEVTVKARTSGHQYHVGKKYKVTAVGTHAPDTYTLTGHGHSNNWWIIAAELCGDTRAELEQELKELRKQADDVEDKLHFLHVSGADEFDAAVYKAWHALKLLGNSGLSELEKAKELAKLLQE